jgi:NAD(P)-dependent dehydrogenase (short-subunit alcohol dehydrogenase family)
MARLDGKRAIVTGGAQGLGESIVERLATEGCSVAIWDINPEKVSETAARIANKTGRQVVGAKVDVCDADAVRRAVDDAAVNSAASISSSPTLEYFFRATLSNLTRRSGGG